MILIFDYFETIVHNRSMDFNRGLRGMWERHYRDRCSFEDISALGDELFLHMQRMHGQGMEYAFVKDELPEYAKRFGGEPVKMSAEEEADFLMACNDMENMPHIPQALAAFDEMQIPMYVLSNSGFTARALYVVLERLGIGRCFKNIWSSADFGRIKPDRAFFEMAIAQALADNPGERRENIAFVGDTYDSDVRGAVAAGINAIWLNHKGERNADELPVIEITGTIELAATVKAMAKW